MSQETSIQPFRGERSQASRPSTRDFVRSLFRYKWAMAGVFAFIAGSITVLTFVLPEIYESEAKVMVKLGRESLFGSDPAVSAAGSQNSGGASTSLAFQVNSQMELLNNAYLAERVVDRIGAAEFLGDADPAESDAEALEQRDRAVRAFMSNLEVHARVDSSIINLAYRAQDPELAHAALDTLLDEYMVHNVKVQATKTSPEFFKKRVDGAQDRLEVKEAELKEFRETNGLTGDPDGQQNGYELAIAELKANIADAKSEQASARARMRTLEEALDGRTRMTVLTQTQGEENRTADALKEQRIELMRELTALESLHPSDHRLVVAARDELRLVEDALAREEESRSVVTTGVDQNYETLMREYDMAKADLESATARSALLENELAVRQADLTELIGDTSTLAQLQREVDLLREEYLDYRENLHLTEVNQALDEDGISNLSVAQPATAPVEPVSPIKALNIAAGIVLGLMAAVGLAFTMYLLDDSITTSENVEEHLEIPVLASITHGEFKKCI